jgi:hypothetical protein
MRYDVGAATRLGIAGAWLTVGGIFVLDASLILFNYICQTTYVPALARAYDPSMAPVISALTLQNPHSLSWAVEMWGYACLGAATWFASAVFDGTRLERVISQLMVANGIVSVAGGVITSVNLDWVITAPGFAAYLMWNALMLGLSILLIVAFRRRGASAGS